MARADCLPAFDATDGAPRARSRTEATVVMACPLAEAYPRSIQLLRESFAICEVTQRRALERVMANLKPDVLVVDLALLGMRRVRGLRDILRLNPSTKIVVLTDAPGDAEG